MIAFRYVARTPTGDRTRGVLRAPDRDTAVRDLHGRALFITALERQRPWNASVRIDWRFGAPSGRARVTFFRSFSTLVHAGVPLRRALQVTIDRGRDASLRDALRDVMAEVEQGHPLSESLARRPRAFSPLVVSMIAAGEVGGILDEVLERIATLLENDEALRKHVLSALAYPATVALASIALVVFLVVRIVPMFAQLFATFRVDLPASTRFLLWVGTVFERPEPWAILGIAGVAAFYGFRLASRDRAGSLMIDRGRLSLPLVGPLLRKTVHARFARMTGTLVRSGIELTRALDVVAPVLGSPLHTHALRTVGLALREGEALAAPLASTRVFDPMLVSLVAVGEETGALDVLMEKAADYFESDVAAAIATLAAVIEPALIVTLGVVVFFIVYSVYIPLYSLIGSLSR